MVGGHVIRVKDLHESHPVALPLNYTEYPPPIDLAPWVACFWQIAGEITDGGSGLHRVLPDGCADVLFDLECNRRSGGSPADLVGPMSGAQVFELRGNVDLLGVRLRPGAICAFSGIPGNLLLDSIVPISELAPQLRINVAELADVADSPARISLLINAYRTRLAALKQPDPIVRHALSRWARAERPGFSPISVLTRDLGLSERAFERRFVAQVGLAPVRYRRLARFRSVLRLHAGGLRDWATLATMTGFSDQSHFVRDCRAFAGLTPNEWAASQAASAGFLQDGVVTTF